MITLATRMLIDRARAYAWTHVTLPVEDVEALLEPYDELARLRVKNAVVPWARVRAVTEALCSCGGAGPGEGCVACEVYHALKPDDEEAS